MSERNILLDDVRRQLGIDALRIADQLEPQIRAYGCADYTIALTTLYVFDPELPDDDRAPLEELDAYLTATRTAPFVVMLLGQRGVPVKAEFNAGATDGEPAPLWEGWFTFTRRDNGGAR